VPDQWARITSTTAAAEEAGLVGIRPGCVDGSIVPGCPIPSRAERQKDNHEAYWESFWHADQVFYVPLPIWCRRKRRHAIAAACLPSLS
jgi:hypothetical protein